MEAPAPCKNSDKTRRHLAFIIIGSFIGFSFAQLFMLIAVPIFWPQAKFAPEFWVLLGNITGFMGAKAAVPIGYYYIGVSKETKP